MADFEIFNTRTFLRSLVIVGSVLLPGIAFSSDRVSQGQGREATLTGTWFLSLPGGPWVFHGFHEVGTATGDVSTSSGGAPQRPTGPMGSRGEDGIWERTDNGFEAVKCGFNNAVSSGDVLRITRVRVIFTLGPGSETGSGEWLMTNWSATAPVECPDPNVADSGPPGELARSGKTFTMTRVRLWEPVCLDNGQVGDRDHHECWVQSGSNGRVVCQLVEDSRRCRHDLAVLWRTHASRPVPGEGQERSRGRCKEDPHERL